MGKTTTDLSTVTTVGLDLAEHVFQVHGLMLDASGRVVVTKAMRRSKLLEFFYFAAHCVVRLEASGSAHHGARELIKLGHEARMVPSAYVKPYLLQPLAEERRTECGGEACHIARVARSCGLVVAWDSASMFLFKSLPLL